jgi:hypothetical protein
VAYHRAIRSTFAFIIELPGTIEAGFYVACDYAYSITPYPGSEHSLEKNNFSVSTCLGYFFKLRWPLVCWSQHAFGLLVTTWWILIVPINIKLHHFIQHLSAIWLHGY